MSKSLLSAMCLLSTCGITYSCSDDYDLDETTPDFLGGSIYDELKARNFSTVVRLIDDLGYAETLFKTGSKTLFAANDEAYARFFASTDWKDASGNPVRSYDQLTMAQKRLLINNAMLNNPYVLEMMCNTEGDRGKNLCLRQTSSASATDTITFWLPSELPNNQNAPAVDGEGEDGDTRFWDDFKQPDSKGIYMATDNTSAMMTHFLENQLKEKSIKHSDIAFIIKGDKTAWAEDTKRSYIYDREIINEDVTCMNGYLNILDEVLVTPPNMAEVIRTNGSTSLFSAMLERFSAPVYDESLRERYADLHDIGDAPVYHKIYIANRSQTGEAPTSVKVGETKTITLNNYPYLAYDPGWNEYAISSTTPKEHDMAAMFVPNDAAMEDYFIQGQGRVLIERYATRPNTKENLLFNLHQIPLDIIQALINNLMKDSFNESVPSKYLTIMNDAQDQMFDANNYETEEQYLGLLDKALLANNGVVYIMNKVIAPADYAAVIAPVLYMENAKVMRAVARADENYIEGSSYNNAPLKQYYSTYLKAMQSRFSFFVPTDEGLATYGLVDPMSLARNAASASYYRYWRLTYSNKNKPILPIQADAYKYNVATGQRPSDTDRPSGSTTLNTSAPGQSLTTGTGLIKKSLLIDMMDHHIIVHDNDDRDGINGSASYYLARSGAPVYVKHKGDVNNYNVGMLVDGGLQMQVNSDEYPDNDHDCEVVKAYDQTGGEGGYGNGMTYFLDRPMQATTRSVANVLSHDEAHYAEFFKLCQTAFSEDLLLLAGFKTEEMVSDGTLWTAEQDKYRIFTNATGYNPAQGDEGLVRFFNNYRYTIYAPTNDAVQRAYANGLPTYEEIESFINANVVEEGDERSLSPENQLKAQAMITTLINFIKYHFQDQSFFVDNVNGDESSYQTSCIDNELNTYLSIKMKQTPGNITVTDLAGHSQSVIAPYNVLARDANFDKSVASTATSIKNSSYAVIHQVGEVLNFMPLQNGRYDSAWATASSAKAFLAKYRIRK